MKNDIKIFLQICWQKIIEYIRYKSKAGSSIILASYFLEFLILRLIGERERALLAGGKIFRQVKFEYGREFSYKILGNYIKKYGHSRLGNEISRVLDRRKDMVSKLKHSILIEKRPFDKRLIILSAPIRHAKGVLLVKFSEYFKYLPEVFDLEELGKRYVLILEPSWAGYFEENILCLVGKKIRIVVEASEPVDYSFISILRSNLIPIDIGANCWVDERNFMPLGIKNKEFDIVMVALWAKFKRHYHLFEALSKCKEKGKVKIALIGKPWPISLREMQEIASYYGVEKNVTFFENLSQPKINELLNRSKIYLLLSKKEGFNKSIIESLYADTPVFLLEGFNFGYRYPYINDKTGGFLKAAELSKFIDRIDYLIEEKRYAPYQWIKENISSKLSTKKIRELLGKIEIEDGVEINKEIAIKVNNPDCDYLEKDNWERFSEEYSGLKVYLRN